MNKPACFPKISIVTPTFNQGEFIEETILSVLGQNYPNLEYLIIDGGSTDNTVEIIRKYEKRLDYWVSEKDKGQSHAINKGFQKATGDVVMWLNSDDLLMPGALSMVIDRIELKPLGIYFGNCVHFKRANEDLISYGSSVVSHHKNCLLENFDYIIQPSSFWTKKTWELVGELNENMHYGFDWEWFLRAKNKNVTFSPFNTCLSMYRIHESHKTGTGGSVRDRELAMVYRNFAPLNEALFNYLIEDKFLFDDRFPKMLKRIAKFFYGSMTEIKVLKFLKPSKYRFYSEETIMQVRQMILYN